MHYDNNDTSNVGEMITFLRERGRLHDERFPGLKNAIDRLCDFYEGDYLPEYILFEFARIWDHHPKFNPAWRDAS